MAWRGLVEMGAKPVRESHDSQSPHKGQKAGGPVWLQVGQRTDGSMLFMLVLVVKGK